MLVTVLLAVSAAGLPVDGEAVGSPPTDLYRRLALREGLLDRSELALVERSREPEARDLVERRPLGREGCYPAGDRRDERTRFRMASRRRHGAILDGVGSQPARCERQGMCWRTSPNFASVPDAAESRVMCRAPRPRSMFHGLLPEYGPR